MSKLKRKPEPGCLFCRHYVRASHLVTTRSACGHVTVVAVCRKSSHKRHARSIGR